MARLNHKGEYWSHLTDASIIRDETGTPGDTTVDTAGGTKGATTIAVVAITNFTDGDIVRIGVRDTLEINQIEGAPNTTMPLRFPLMYDHVAGEEFTEQQANDLGHVHDDGVNITFSGDHNPVMAVTKRLATAYLTGHAEIQAEFSLLGFAEENIAVAIGQPEGDVAGSGTTASPYTIAVTADDFNTENDLSWRFNGVRKDGGIVILDLMATEMDFSALAINLRRGDATPIPCRPKATSGLRVSHYLT
jgi:hypothetical protein